MYRSREIFPIGRKAAQSLDTSITSGVVYDVREFEAIEFQLVKSTTWPSGAILTLQGCTRDDPNTWTALQTNVTFDATNVDNLSGLIPTIGIAFVRLYVSTTGTSITVEVYARGVWEERA